MCAVLMTRVCVAAPPDDGAERIGRLVPGWEPSSLEAQQWKIVPDMDNAWVRALTPADYEPQRVQGSGGYEVAGHVLVEEAQTGKWYWGQKVSEDELKNAHEFTSFDAFIVANAFAPLPRAPAPFQLRQLAALTFQPTALASDRQGRHLYLLAGDGDVHRIELATRRMERILHGRDYAGEGQWTFMGIALCPQDRLYLVGNRTDLEATPAMNHVTLFRSHATDEAKSPTDLRPWLEQSIPYAISVFQHGVSKLGFGPDGLLYVSSGSRTDANEPGDEENRSREGETPLTACIWRLDPRDDQPQIEIFARGLRNAYGFCWDEHGQMWATDNGPNRDPPEELNLVEEGGHYGFPHQFSDWTTPAYTTQPPVPQGVELKLPVQNLGPAGGGSAERPISTFDPHSSPSGLVFLDERFAPEFRGSLLVARFGNFLGQQSGFDVLLVKPLPRTGPRLQAEVRTFLSPIARPTDMHMTRNGRIFIAEFSRQVRNEGSDLPGRILELAAE
jgi:hypothetical protein